MKKPRHSNYGGAHQTSATEVMARTATMLVGTALGQGAFLVTSLMYLKRDSGFIGNIGTAYGIIVSTQILIDWGGTTSQRQLGNLFSPSSIAKRFIFFRMPIGMLAAVLLAFAAIAGWLTPTASEFILYALPTIVASTCNLTGLLDIVDKRAAHTIGHGLPVAALSIYLLSSDAPTAGSAGIAYSSGYCMLLVYQFVRVAKCKGAFEHLPSLNISSGKILAEGVLILGATLPGQIATRMAAILLLSIEQPTLAAIYNTVKQGQGLLTQVVTLIRRAEYGRALSVLERAKSQTTPMIAKSQQFSLGTGGVLALVYGIAVAVLARHDEDLYLLGIAASTQTFVWLLTSSYFFHFQLMRRNSVQAMYGIIHLAFFATVIFLFSPNTPSLLILAEVLCSLGAVYLAHRYLGASKP